MNQLIEELRTMIDGTDLEIYKDSNGKILFALNWAVNEINNRRGFVPNDNELYPAKYKFNIVQGAIYYLGKIGAEGYQSTTENGVSVTWKSTPDWLSSVPPAVKMF